MQTHIGCTKVARDTDQVGVLGTVAIDDILLAGFTDAGDADGQSGIRRGGVTTHDIDVPFLASQSEACIELLHILYGEALAEGK